MIKLEPYTLNHVPDYCLYSKTYSSLGGQLKFGIIYLNANTKFNHWFEKHLKTLSKRTDWIQLRTNVPMQALCCSYVRSNLMYVQLKQQRRVQGLKDGEGYRKFLQWVRKETFYGNILIWFTSYRYLEQLYKGTLWSNSKNIR